MPFPFAIIKERANQRRVQIVPCQSRGWPIFFSLNEAKKKTKSVTIASNRVGAHMLLGHKPFREELLE